MQVRESLSRDRLAAAPDGKGEMLLMMYKAPAEAIA